MPAQRAQHVSMAIDRSYSEAYDFLSRPANFPQWASGLGHSFVHLQGMEWQADTPMGRLRVRFSSPNEHGILDHYVTLEDGTTVYNPMRIFANGDGSEVVFTLFQRPGMSDAEFARDAEWIQKDLGTLKKLLEGNG